MKQFLRWTRLVTHVDKSFKLFKDMKIKTLLDLGAGGDPQFKIREQLGIRSLLVDIKPKMNNVNVISLDVRDSKNIRKKIMDYFGESQVDCVVALHLIEHLEKTESLTLLNDLETYAKKLVIIETPNGFLRQPPSPDNPFQEHLCGYTVKELRNSGFKVTGTTGLKILRNNFDKGSYRGNWQILHSLDRILFFVLHHFPRLSFNLFAYKILSNN